jgi:hypothetical protein
VDRVGHLNCAHSFNCAAGPTTGTTVHGLRTPPCWLGLKVRYAVLEVATALDLRPTPPHPVLLLAYFSSGPPEVVCSSPIGACVLCVLGYLLLL